jgi:signal transduction histidine kinase
MEQLGIDLIGYKPWDSTFWANVMIDDSLDGVSAEGASEIQALRAELQRTRLAYQMAMEMAQFQAGFLARTSHELRSPINSVISLHQLILADLADNPEEERDFIRQSAGAAEKMLGVLDQLISISKTTCGTEQLHLQSLRLIDLFAEIKTLTHLQAKNRNLRLEMAMPDSELYVLADPKWLQQVLLSLVDTSIRLMPEGTIRVTTQTEAQQVQICIEDERPAEFWSEPLDLLQLLKGRSAVTSEGLLPSPGLSLMMNQTLMEVMGGRLEVLAVPLGESAVTRIRCLIPREG